MSDTKALVPQSHGAAIGQAELGLSRVFGSLDGTSQIVSDLVSTNPDAFHILGPNTMFSRQVQYRLNTRLGVAAGGVEFVVGISDGKHFA